MRNFSQMVRDAKRNMAHALPELVNAKTSIPWRIEAWLRTTRNGTRIRISRADRVEHGKVE
jgi:hypothetical protein